MDALIGGIAIGPNQLIAVGSSLYYITKNQIASGGQPGNTQVYKSTNKTTWALVAQWDSATMDPPSVTSDAGFTVGCLLVGTTIYIGQTSLDTNGPPIVKTVLHRFSTLTDTFLTNSVLGPVVGGSGQTFVALSLLNNGQLLISSSTTALFGPVGAPQLQVQLYTPGTDTWAAPVIIVADSSFTVKQIHDPVSDLTFVFYQKTIGGTQIRCATVTPALAFTDTLVFTQAGGVGGAATGLPFITTAGEVVLPFTLFPFPPVLKAARSPVQAAPVFSVDVIEDYSALPVGSVVQQYDQSLAGGWAMQEINGLLYVFYVVDNGDLDSAASQAFLYYRSSTGPGVWGNPLIAFSSAIPGELLAPFGVQIPGFNPVILLGVISPTLFPSITSLSNFILFPVGGEDLIINFIGAQVYEKA
jgi:hypothetical protein